MARRYPWDSQFEILSLIMMEADDIEGASLDFIHCYYHQWSTTNLEIRRVQRRTQNQYYIHYII